jgi:hypothetical protein
MSDKSQNKTKLKHIKPVKMLAVITSGGPKVPGCIPIN